MIAAAVAADDTLSTSNATFSAIAKAAAINKSSGTHEVTATVESNSYTGNNTVGAGDLASGDLTINDYSFGTISGVLNDDDGGHLAAAINAASATTGVTAAVSGGVLTLSAADGRNIEVLQADTNANSTVTGLTAPGAGALTLVDYGEVTLTSNADFTLAGSQSTSLVGLAEGDYTVDRTDVVNNLSVVTKADANSALGTIDKAIDQISERRGDLGALQNRFESTISNLQAVSENLTASRSRIRDADFATETAELTKAQIVQQAGVAILAQANASPQMALALLS